MKIIILKENLKNGLDVVERIVSKNSNLPILSNVLIATDKSLLKLSTTDLELGINYWILAQIEKENRITCPAKLFSSFISSLPEGKITLETKDTILSIQCQNFQSQIKGESGEGFPIIPKINKEKFLEINPSFLCQGLLQVISFCAPIQVKPELSGIFFKFEKDRLKLVATDSFRLAEKNLIYEKPSSQAIEVSFILPQKAAREIINIFSEKKEKIKLYYSPNQVLLEAFSPQFQHPQIQIISRLIEGEYPNYQEIIPKHSETKIFLEKNDFLNQIKTASLFSGKLKEVKIKANPKQKVIEISSQHPETGQNKSVLMARVEGKEVEVCFNYKFLIEGLLNLKTENIIFELNGDEGAALLKGEGDPSFLYVVMPIKAS